VARSCRKVGAPRSATASPPPRNRIVSLAGTAGADFSPTPPIPLAISRQHSIPRSSRRFRSRAARRSLLEVRQGYRADLPGSRDPR